MVAFVPILASTAYNIATRTIGKKALQQAITKYGKPFIQTLQNIGKNRDKVNKSVKKFNKTSKELEKKSKIEKTKAKKKEAEKKKKAKEKKVEEAKPLKKASKAATTITKNVAKDISQLAKLADKITFGLGGKTLGVGKELVKGTVKTAVKHPVYTAGGIYGTYKAADIGSKLFKGRAITDTGKGEDITSEVTGNGADTKASAPATAGSGGIADFISAHNSAMDSGQEWFKFNGQAYRVGSTRMADF